MRVATVDGLVTLFYDGSKPLYNQRLNREWIYIGRRRAQQGRMRNIASLNFSLDCKRYIRERLSWQQVIIEEGVTKIPEFTFSGCINIKRVIFANSVVSIEKWAIYLCKNLDYIKLPTNLEYIGPRAFGHCNLSSVFVPPTCREIGEFAFYSNKNLSILHIPRQTQLGERIIDKTKLLNDFFNLAREDPSHASRVVNDWLKNVNDGNDYSLHRACSSFQPLKEIIHTIIEEKGLKAFKHKNLMGITPSRYLAENPYSDITEIDVIRDYITKQMGEYV